MKILVAVANYGTGNDNYLAEVLGEFRQMRHEVHIVANTNIPKNLGPDVEVVVGFPTKNPKSLPFAHKQTFADRLEEYDVFIYTEDDTLITERNIDAFLSVTEVLPKNQIAGYLRTETRSDGKVYFPDVINQYRWDVSSVCSMGGYDFAYFTDEHSGCYILTREQLRQAITSGGYLVPFHEGKYPPLETAATDPYAQCGLRKMICISHLGDFLLPHLSNKYAGNGITVPAEDFYAQLSALACLAMNGKTRASLFPVETNLYHQHWSKSYYEPCQSKLIALIPERSKSVLSVGCGWGATEKQLIENGMRVKAVPMDSVIAASAASRGIEIIHGDVKTAREKLSNERFDCILFSKSLHLVAKPVEFLASFTEFLNPGGCVIASVPNLSWLRRLSRRIRLRGHVANPASYNRSGMHTTTGRMLRRWFRLAGLKPNKMIYEVLEEGRRADQLLLGQAKPWIGSDVYLRGVAARN